MFAVKLAGGAVCFRLDPDPVDGEEIVDSRLLPAAPTAFERYDWTADAVVPLDAAEVEGRLLLMVDERRDRGMAALLAANSPRTEEYLNKSMEAYNDIGPWPYLGALAAARGTTIEDERLAVIEAREIAAAAPAAFAGVALAGKTAIRNAATVVDKLAAFQSIPWPQGN